MPGDHVERQVTRNGMSLFVLVIVTAAILVLAPEVFLIVFAGLLFGVFVGSPGSWLARRIGTRPAWGIALFLLMLLVSISTIALGFLPLVAEQVDQLAKEVPAAFEQLRSRLEEHSWGERALERVSPDAVLSNGGGGAATSAVTSTFGALGTLIVILFIGLYVAFDPATYRKGLVSLVGPYYRPTANTVIVRATATLESWLMAQLMSMATVGAMTWLGLWIVGVPLAPILGLLAAFLAFIPNIGPVIAAAPAVLLAIPGGATSVILVVAVYVVVQALESYLITPLIQQEQVSLPPAVIISAQLLMGVLFGILGLALATPIAAVVLTLVQEFYVRRYLDDEPARPEVF